MLREFKLPDVGEGLTDAEIIKWHVSPGDTVKINQTIVEIETAKAVVELPCPYDGVVASLLVAEGETVDVGTPIIGVETEPQETRPQENRPHPVAPQETSPRETALPDTSEVRIAPVEGAVEPGVYGGPAPRTAPRDERQPVLVGYGVKLSATKRRPRKAGTGPDATVSPPVSSPVSPVRVLAKPPVRKLAKDLGVDLAGLVGTGPQGSITRADVQVAAEGVTAPAEGVTAPAAQPREERVPVKGVRKITAAAMVASAFTAPHVTEFLQVDVTATVDAVGRLRELPDFAEVKVSPLLLAARALIIAVKRYPAINSSWDDDAIVIKHYVNLGIAAATERGLVVPNVKDAHTLSLPELAAALSRLTDTARAGRTQPAEMTGGTITITNVGVFGVDAGTPILNTGEAAILAIGQIRDLPWVVDGAVVPRKVCTLALAFDHRVVDGELGSYVLRDVGAMLSDPLRMLAWG